MNSNFFAPEQLYELPVKEARTNKNGVDYFIVTKGEMEYSVRMLAFQKQSPLPETLCCAVKEVNDKGQPVFVQDFATLYAQFYKEGETYTFQVRKDFTETQPYGYYEVGDNFGFYFKLFNYGTARLKIKQFIRCKVASLKGRALSLALSEEEETVLPPELEEIQSAIHIPEALASWCKHSPSIKPLRDSYISGNSQWLRESVKFANKNLYTWISRGNRRPTRLLETGKAVGLYLLENSDYLSKLPSPLSLELEKQIAWLIQQADFYLEAISILKNGKAETYINDIIEKISTSGCLYHSDKRLKILNCLCLLSINLLDQNAEKIFQSMAQSPANWQKEQIKPHLAKLLDFYIQQNRVQADFMDNNADTERKTRIQSLVKALSIRILLCPEENDDNNLLHRSMLYRYLSFVDGSNVQILLEKALACLTGTIPDKLEYGWNGICDVMLQALKLSNSYQPREQTFPLKYESEQGHLIISPDNGIALCTPKALSNPTTALPKNCLPWHNLQIHLTKKPSITLSQKNKDVNTWQELWMEIERALRYNTLPTIQSTGKKKLTPEVGERVYIRILYQSYKNPEYYFCRIADSTYEGQGMLCLKNIVRFNLHGIEKDAFFSEKDQPYLLQADIQGIDQNGRFAFNMLAPLGEFIYQTVNVGDTVRCMVTEQVHDFYLCISEYAYSVQVSLPENAIPLQPGDYLDAQVNAVRPNGTVTADFLHKTDETFSLKEAFYDLMASYADDNVYEAYPPAPSHTNCLTRPQMKELMHIIDRVAGFGKTHVSQYNYTAYARLVALAIKEEQAASYYTMRMKLLQLLQYFAVNGHINIDRHVKEWQATPANETRTLPLLQAQIDELHILSCIDRPGHDHELWERSTAIPSKESHLARLARLVLSYNLLRDFSTPEQKEALYASIHENLSINVDIPQRQYFGMEDQHTEFKTSIVYSPLSHHPDIQVQTEEIMKVACGFLNAGGGTLYLGVNDAGGASGLKDDLEFFNGSRDKFDLHVRNHIVESMGLEANSCITVSHPEADDKWIYALHISPCPSPVYCHGTCYQRQGSSTWPLTGNALEAFLNSRAGQCIAQECPPAETGKAEASTQKTTGTEDATSVPTAERATPVSPKSSLPENPSVHTSQLRRNAIHSYEDGFGEETICYFHLLSDHRYLLTMDESWRNDILISLAIQEQERNGYLVIMYESGQSLRVPIGDLLDKTPGKEYKCCSTEQPFFISPAGKDDAFLSVVAENQGTPAFRLDELDMLKESNMLSKGQVIRTAQTYGVLQCEIIPNGQKELFRRITGLKPCNQGVNLMTEWGAPERESMEHLGLKLLFA